MLLTGGVTGGIDNTRFLNQGRGGEVRDGSLGVDDGRREEGGGGKVPDPYTSGIYRDNIRITPHKPAFYTRRISGDF